MKNKYDVLYEILDFIRLCTFCFILATLFTTFVFRPVEIIGSSMEPTLEDNERGFSNVFSMFFSDVNRFDIVVVKSKENNGEYWVKRVIGLPNETIECKNNNIYIDDKIIKQDFLPNMEDEYYTDDFEQITLGDDEYFLMGDHRKKSYDSRYEEVGPFKKSDILSKDVYIYYPFDRIRIVE